MDERILSRVLFVLGFGTLGVASFFGAGWDEAGVLERIAFVAGTALAVIAVGLDFRHRHQDKQSQTVAGGGSV